MTGHRPAPILERIDAYVDHWAARTPDAEFLIDGGPTFTGRRLTWADTRAQVDRVAAALIAAGVAPGERVAYLADSRLNFFVHFLATSSIGAIWQGLNPKYTDEELDYVVGDAAPRLVFDGSGGQRSEALTAAASVERVIDVDGEGWPALLAAGDTIDPAHLADRRTAVDRLDPAFIVYTSGSTGRPKGALLTHHGYAHCGVHAIAARRLYHKRMICNLPINHVGSVSDICGRTMIGGGTLVMQERFDPELMMATIEAEQVQVWGGVPTIFQLCLAHPTFADRDLTCVDQIAWGGAGMPVPVLEALFAATGALRGTVGYGMTEMTGGISCTAPESTIEQLTTTAGVPMDGFDWRIVDGDGTECPTGEAGEIQVRGDWMMTGYWNRPDADTEAFTDDGWFKTSDLGLLRHDGHLQLVGRLSDMFKSGGYNTYPREIELCLEDHPSVSIAAVVGVPDPVFDEVGHAFVVAPGATAGDLIAHCRERLANYKVPKVVHLRDALPMLAVGKIDKRALKADTDSPG